MDTVKPKRIISFDVLRIIAILAVIMVHVISTSNTFSVASPNSFTFIYGTVLKAFASVGVPVFIMISGALMLNEEKPLTNRQIFKKALSLLTLLIFWSVAYATYDGILYPLIRGQKITNVTAFIKNVVVGHYHLWFLYMLIGLYMLTPIFRLFVKKQNQKYILYFILISVIFQFSTPLVNILANNVLPDSLSSIVAKVSNSFYMNFTFGYTSYFFIGWYIANFDFKKLYNRLIYAFGLCCFFAIIIIPIVLAKRGIDASLCSNLDITVLGFSVGIFTLIYNLFKNKTLSEKTSKLITKTSYLTFGVYLIHIVFVDICCNLIKNPNFAFLDDFLLEWVLIAVASFISTLVLSFIPYVKKLIKI